ncbi:hypothetical protein BDV28DRAFT_57883 [Aspergillus coremiiformis]|uniref:Uncharacterized protein n=1 Tax=Aspergillus coremiiformis TaxID=138285 RepID=A0A5N6ZD57_9EURO|nr:hypothetical protein BDV28DRAFT_57883 [Aspergillus coremiiformis]
MVANSRPRPRLTRWNRLVRFIHMYESPLCLRGSLIRLRHQHRYPFLALLCLFLPLPAWHFRLPEPVPPQDILDNISLFEARQPPADLINLRSIPIWRARDTPVRSLYRIYEAMAARQYTAISSEVEYFWKQVRQSWAVHRIPDPGDHDPIRYALLASIAEELANAFNWRLEMGMRRDVTQNIYRDTFDDELPPFTPEVAPCWTRGVPAIAYHLIQDLPDNLQDSSGNLVLEKGGQNRNFAKRNIVTNTGFFRTV